MHAATVFCGVVGMMRIQRAGCMCEAARQLSTEDLTELLRAKEASGVYWGKVFAMQARCKEVAREQQAE